MTVVMLAGLEESGRMALFPARVNLDPIVVVGVALGAKTAPVRRLVGTVGMRMCAVALPDDGEEAVVDVEPVAGVCNTMV